MTEYGEKKCELLERNGFKANNLAWWVIGENERTRTYAYVGKKVGSEVKSATISITDGIAEMNEKYRKLLEALEEYKDYLKTECGSEDKIPYSDAETSNTMDYISTLASQIDSINRDAHDVECGYPWSEVSDIFECDVPNDDTWYLKDDPELFGEED